MLRTFALRWSSFLLAAILMCLPQVAGAQASIFMLLPTDDRVLEVGGEHTGALSASDYTGITGEYVEAWALEGRVGASVTLVLEANGFDGELMVAGRGLPELLRTSDYGYGAQPCVDFTFLDGGTFHVVVTNRQPRGTGLYTLRVVESPDGSGDGCEALRDSDLLGLPTEGRELSTGSAETGSLGADDPTVRDEYADAWSLNGQAGETFTITMESDEFDPYLYLVNATGVLDSNDDGAGSQNSRITATLSGDGPFVVVATAYSGSGEYTIRVEAGAVADDYFDSSSSFEFLDPDYLDLPTEGRELSADSAGNGQLGSEDPMVDGKYAEAWSLTGEALETITITMESNDFDTYLYLTDATGIVDYNDDGGSGTDSQITATLSGFGPYTVVATAYSGSGSGQYTIRADEGTYNFDSSDTLESDILGLPTEDRELSAGSSEIGNLGFEDPMVDGENAEAWSLVGQAGDRVSITMASDEFDTFLYLVDANGIIETDDDGGGGTDSQIEATLTGDGPFTVVASAYSGSGEYTIAFSPGPSGVQASLVDAVESRDAASVNRLLEDGADPNVTFVYEGVGGATALMVAAGEGYPDIVNTLLEHGADPNLTVSAEAMSGITALFIAAIDGDWEITRALLAYGADVNVTLRDGRDELTMLGLAAIEGETEIVTLLLENGADPNRMIRYEGREGTALKLAADEGHTDVMNVLLEYGAEDLR